jgi:surfeit locus 1 family protein
VSPGRRAFAPTPGFTLLALLLALSFVRLGVWQWHRGSERSAERDRFEQGTAQLVELGARAATAVPLYQRVSVRGRLDRAHQFLLDNRTFRGRAGYEVLTPLERTGAPALLIDRGWVPFTGTRSQLPEVGIAASGGVELTGRLALLPSSGLASGRAAPEARAPWPKVTSYPDMEQLAAALAAPLEPRILLLDPQAPFGYLREWHAPGLQPLRHYAYAIQWWAFAMLTAIAWGLMSRRPGSEAAQR